MLTLNILAQKIKVARLDKGWSQAELGKRANVSRAQIDRIENLRLSDVGLTTILHLLRALDLDLLLSPLNHGRPTLTQLRNNPKPTV